MRARFLVIRTCFALGGIGLLARRSLRPGCFAREADLYQSCHCQAGRFTRFCQPVPADCERAA
jgi:hypothetical protein